MNTLTEDEFDAAFDVVPDPVTGDEVRSTDQGLDKDSRHVWTIIDGENGLYAVSGWHRVNRVGYVVTTQPWESDTEAEWFVECVDETGEADSPHGTAPFPGPCGEPIPPHG